MTEEEKIELAKKALRLAVIRLGILIGRMHGCNEQAREEGRKITHELMDEAEMFQDEAVEALRSLE